MSLVSLVSLVRLVRAGSVACGGDIFGFGLFLVCYKRLGQCCDCRLHAIELSLNVVQRPVLTGADVVGALATCHLHVCGLCVSVCLTLFASCVHCLETV